MAWLVSEREAAHDALAILVHADDTVRDEVDVRPGDEHTSKHSAPGLWALLDRTARDCWPTLLRGDASFGNEPVMHEAEQRDLAYLFKLRLTANVQRAIKRLSSEREWIDAGQGFVKLIRLSSSIPLSRYRAITLDESTM